MQMTTYFGENKLYVLYTKPAEYDFAIKTLPYKPSIRIADNCTSDICTTCIIQHPAVPLIDYTFPLLDIQSSLQAEISGLILFLVKILYFILINF